MEGTLQLNNVCKSYGSTVAVDQVDLTVDPGEFVTLLGSSGSGKTTTLLMIAGFETPTSGDLVLNGERLNAVPPHQRNIGMMFQNYALFPHLTVFQNIAYPLRLRRRPREEIQRRVREALSLVRLEGFERRYPSELSGGQQQRIALARATVFGPSLLLMDEPLSALDRGLRQSMQEEIRRIKRDLGTTIVYVTHDQDEALTLSDRVVLMHGGRIVQVGTPEEIYARPVDAFTAEFIGESSRLSVRVEEAGGGSCVLRLRDGHVLRARCGDSIGAGADAVLRVRPSRIRATRAAAPSTSEASGAAAPRVSAVVDDVAFLGDVVQYHAATAWGERLLFDRDALEPGFQLGDQVCLSWDEADGYAVT